MSSHKLGWFKVFQIEKVGQFTIFFVVIAAG